MGAARNSSIPLRTSWVDLMKKHILVVLLSISGHAFAANCTDLQSESEMTTCVGQEYASQDKKLNAAYSQYRSRLSESQKNQLKDAQSAWIKYRDLSCDFEGSGVKGGSAYPMIYSVCRTEKTTARLREINKLLNCQEGDLSCPAH
jgi:uncharacterized protein YecT (DUF1311 family)